MNLVTDFSKLSVDEAQRQHTRLLGARTRLLRTAQLMQRKRILEIGAGWGFAADEMADQTGRIVTAVDREEDHISFIDQHFGHRVQGQAYDVCQLPYEPDSFDLIFAQFSFLWLGDLELVMQQVARVLAVHGVLAAIEPDFGGVIDFPTSYGLRDIWIEALEAAGAQPLIGRKLVAQLRSAGFNVQVLLCDRLEPVDSGGLEMLLSLPLGEENRRRVLAAQGDIDRLVCHVPLFLVLAESRKP